ncbi:MAG: hypothetical protein D6732_24705 [Methanobacteriota archaeon]|nr:MAG: hypothetical protein D6732_24705 [Euryarchaeota archaeon]
MHDLGLEMRNLEKIAKELEAFEASKSRARTGTGSRREGEKFEIKVLSFWDAVAERLEAISDACEPISINRKSFNKITLKDRSLYLPASISSAPLSGEKKSWFLTSFHVGELLKGFPGEVEVVSRYAPETGPYAGSKYPSIYSGLTTRFDGTIVCVEDGFLKKKILLEYKTGKASNGEKIDGNAHERLSFQMLQYLEVATRYPKCSFVVITNGAFVRYRNKYHPIFNQQADRLANFCWFDMAYYSQAQQYLGLAKNLKKWLEDGE